MFDKINNAQQHTENVDYKNNQHHPQISSNLIYIGQENSSDKHQQQACCRICLEKGVGMISPCMCKGSLSYVHEECMKQWLVHQIKKKIRVPGVGGIKYQACEICKDKIGYISTENKHCGCRMFFHRLKTEKFFLCLHLTALILFLSGVIIFLLALLTSILNIGSMNTQQSAIVIFAIFQTFLLLGFLVLLYQCIIQNFIEKEIIIQSILKTHQSHLFTTLAN